MRSAAKQKLRVELALDSVVFLESEGGATTAGDDALYFITWKVSNSRRGHGSGETETAALLPGHKAGQARAFYRHLISFKTVFKTSSKRDRYQSKEIVLVLRKKVGRVTSTVANLVIDLSSYVHHEWTVLHLPFDISTKSLAFTPLLEARIRIYGPEVQVAPLEWIERSGSIPNAAHDRRQAHDHMLTLESTRNSTSFVTESDAGESFIQTQEEIRATAENGGEALLPRKKLVALVKEKDTLIKRLRLQKNDAIESLELRSKDEVAHLKAQFNAELNRQDQELAMLRERLRNAEENNARAGPSLAAQQQLEEKELELQEYRRLVEELQHKVVRAEHEVQELTKRVEEASEREKEYQQQFQRYSKRVAELVKVESARRHKRGAAGVGRGVEEDDEIDDSRSEEGAADSDVLEELLKLRKSPESGERSLKFPTEPALTEGSMVQKLSIALLIVAVLLVLLKAVVL